MARLRQGPSDYDLVLRKPGTDTWIGLMFDRKAPNFAIAAKFLPVAAGQETSVQFLEWTYQPGKGGAVVSIETKDSYADGSCDWGEFVWLRRDGVAQPAGQLTELLLGTQVTGITTSMFTVSFIWPTPRDIWITTRSRYVVQIPNGTDQPVLKDLGPGVETWGAGLFGGAATGNVFYVGNPNGPIQAYDGHAWSSGVANYRMCATDPVIAAFYHVIGDPKVANNWSAPITVGDPLLPIQSIASSNHNVWFGKPNGAHQADGLGYTPVISEWFQLAFSPNNLQAMAYWGGMLWLGHEQGLQAIDPSGQRVDLEQMVQFGYGTSNGPIFGRPRCFAPSPLGLYVSYYNGTDSYVGTVRLKGETAHWSMAECVIRGSEVTWLREVWDGNGNPQLMIGTREPSGRLHLFRQSLPLSGDPEQDHLHGQAFKAAPEWMVRTS